MDGEGFVLLDMLDTHLIFFILSYLSLSLSLPPQSLSLSPHLPPQTHPSEKTPIVQINNTADDEGRPPNPKLWIVKEVRWRVCDFMMSGLIKLEMPCEKLKGKGKRKRK